MISVFLPLRVVSTTNAREHWTRRAARAKEQRSVTGMLVTAALNGTHVSSPLGYLYWSSHHRSWRVMSDAVLGIALQRIAPRPLDSDNLAAGFKAIRDGVADALGLRDDADPRVTWSYAQQRGKPREYACRVEIRPRDASSESGEGRFRVRVTDETGRMIYSDMPAEGDA